MLRRKNRAVEHDGLKKNEVPDAKVWLLARSGKMVMPP